MIGSTTLAERKNNLATLIPTTGRHDVYLVFSEAGLKIKDFTVSNN